MTKERFGNAFRKACRAAGIRKSAHGLRKLAATRAADADATIWQLNAMFGWTGTKMAMRYTQAADRKRLAREGRSNQFRLDLVANWAARRALMCACVL